MSIQDYMLLLSDDQSIAAAVSGTPIDSTQHMDVGAASHSIGPGTPLYLNIRVGTAVTSTVSTDSDGGKFSLQSFTDSAFTTPVNLWSKQLTRAGLTAGTWIARVSIPYEQSQRFLQIQYHNIADTAWATGKVDAWISSATPDTDVGA